MTGPMPNAPGRVVATYDYTDQDGELLYQVLRYKPKTFRQRRPDGNGGWTWNLDGIERVPYRLPAVTGVEDVGVIFIVEGEKDCDGLRERGIVATTSPGGASHWPPHFEMWFEGHDI